MKRAAVLIVAPGAGATWLAGLLKRSGYAVSLARDGASARRALGETPFDAVVTRLAAPRLDGLQVMAHARALRPAATVVVWATEADRETAGRVISEGADDLQIGDLHTERLLAVLRRGVERAAQAARVTELEERLDRRYRNPLTGNSPAIQRVADQIRHAGPTRVSVLVEGERGAGKSRVARALHHASPRRDAAFVRISLGALDPAQAETELFGDPQHPDALGGFERAAHGTLFLDEVDRASPRLQLRLLAAIMGRGAEDPAIDRHVDVRIVAATDQDLSAMVKAGFHPDLLFRLNVVHITVPPLRERREDIPLLVQSFLHEANRAQGRRIGGMTQGALERLAVYDWPGNVAELRDQVESMVLAAHGRRRLDLSDLPAIFREEEREGAAPASPPLAAGMTVGEAERHLIAATLRHTGGDKPRAAAMLGIGLRTLYRKIRAFRLEPGSGPAGRGPMGANPRRPRGR